MANTKNQGTTNRRKGHNAERKFATIFRELGFQHCVTSRKGSRLHDDCKIDLIHIPYNIQIKAGKQRGLNPTRELKLMVDKMNENFPEDHEVHTKPKLVIIDKSVGRGHKKQELDTLVVLSFEDFKKLINKD